MAFGGLFRRRSRDRASYHGTSLNGKRAKIDTLIAKIPEGIVKLKEYRTALISAAVTGKIDVREEVSSRMADSPERNGASSEE